MMTFEDWYRSLDDMDKPQFTNYPGRRLVYSTDPQLWRLSDYSVSSQSAWSVILIERG
jgi:hypothetical protein